MAQEVWREERKDNSRHGQCECCGLRISQAIRAEILDFDEQSGGITSHSKVLVYTANRRIYECPFRCLTLMGMLLYLLDMGKECQERKRRKQRVVQK